MKRKTLLLMIVGLLFVQHAFSQENAFITTWIVETPGDSITIPLPNFNYDFEYAWISGGETIDSGSHTDEDGDLKLILPKADTLELHITGQFPHFVDYPKAKLLDVNQWGDIVWESMEKSFLEWPGVNFGASDVPDLSQVTIMTGSFSDATSFNGDISTWDVSHVTDMSSMFSNADSFNGDLSSWNISQVEDMDAMFDHSGLSSQNYDKLLIGWSKLDGLKSGVRLGATGITYWKGAVARDSLIRKFGWVITDGGSFYSQETDMLSFEMEEQSGVPLIDIDDHTIAIEVSFGADVTALAPTFTLSEGATSSPASGEIVDFSSAVTYTITAENGVTIQDWVVTATVEEEILTVDPGLEWSFYPNPVRDLLKIRSEEEVGVYVVDMSGQIVIPEHRGQQLTLSLEGLESGVYLLIAKSRNWVASEKIIKG